jgi:ribosomal protein S18 acetylase RimI-like enzyme
MRLIEHRMIEVRKYKDQDLYESALLISETFRKFNFNDNRPENSKKYADSYNPKTNLDKIRNRFNESTIFLLAENNKRIVGLVRAMGNRVVNLFVHGNYHKQGIGKMLLNKIENEIKNIGFRDVTLRSQLSAVHFYQGCGYKKTTGIRYKYGLTVQPMKKKLIKG